MNIYDSVDLDAERIVGAELGRGNNGGVDRGVCAGVLSYGDKGVEL